MYWILESGIQPELSWHKDKAGHQQLPAQAVDVVRVQRILVISRKVCNLVTQSRVLGATCGQLNPTDWMLVVVTPPFFQCAWEGRLNR